MNKKNIVAVLTAAVLSVGLTGCGKNAIPDMTDEQVKMISEYVAVTMMKYDANHRSRLVDLPQEDKKPNVPSEPSATEPPSGMGPVDDTPVKDPAATENPYTMEEVLGLPDGVTLAYTGHRLCDVYPDAVENGFFSLGAAKGKKLLVLSFTINNASDQEQRIDLLTSGTAFRVAVNEGRSKRALSSGLPEELTTYSGMIPANSGVETVVLLEVDEETASNMQSISLNVKNGEKSYTEQLL